MPFSCRRALLSGLRCLASALLMSLVGIGLADAQSTADLTHISVEDLMRVEVTSVSKKESRLDRSPAAVFVLTQDDIRRSGLTSVPELLRLVPGLHVARIDGSKWAITARGFTGRFANKLLVLVDGRSVYSPLSSGVYWDEVDLELGDIERIEVVRGPGGTMWGANAVNGVINVITKMAASTQGTSVSLATGSEERLSASARYGGAIGNGLTWRAWGKAFDRAPQARSDGLSANDGWRLGRGGFRVDYRASAIDNVTIQGGAHTGREDQTSGAPMLAPPYRRLFNEQAVVNGRNIVGRWTRNHSAQSETSLQVFTDYTSRSEYLVGQRRSTLDVDFQHRQAPGPRHDVVWGVGYRRGHARLTNSDMIRFTDPDRLEHLMSAFAEDEIDVVPERLTLTLGLKVERNPYTGVELQPNVRALWAVSAHSSVWAALSRGVRTPSLLENGADIDLAAAPGPEGLPVVLTVIAHRTPDAEQLWATEVGYRRHWSTISLDVSAFRNVYAHLLSLSPGAPEFVPAATPFLRLPYLEGADTSGRAYGLEAAGTWRARDGWTLTAGYTYLTLDLTAHGLQGDISPADIEDDSPRHQIIVRSLTSIGRRWEADGAIHALGSSDAGRVPTYVRFDLRAGYKASRHLTVSLAGLNLFDDRHAEMSSVLNEEITQPRRGVLLQTTWTL